MINNPEQKGGVTQGRVKWRSPSNIAIVKYWGKYGTQLPRNPSLSFTLSNAFTETEIQWSIKEERSIDIDFLFEGKPESTFQQKIETFLQSIQEEHFPFLEQLKLKISSTNSFPHSSGIASSASAMSALALGLCSIEEEFNGANMDQKTFLEKASNIARLGSGSASRSVYPEAALWGTSAEVSQSSNEFAIPWEEKLHPVFKTFHDDILIISKKEKSVSSRAGHALMDTNKYAAIRFDEANARLTELIKILEDGDVDAFGELAEAEAMSLHALMMVSTPSYILMKGNTLKAIDKIKTFRAEQKLPVFYTLDAGPNIHLLYPDHIKEEVNLWVEKELKELCEDGRIIKDQVGSGPEKI